MPIRLNPFRKQDENVRPVSQGIDKPANGTATKPISIKEQEQQPTEYKLSEINDSGVFVPPSPPDERKSFWTTSTRSTISRSTTSSNHRSLLNENEPFNISRESFDSYRRSFDISARSPIIQPEQKPRISLDSRTFQAPPRSSNSFHRPLQVPGTQREEEPDTNNLEDVSLDDAPKPPQHKKRGMFSRIMDSSSDPHPERPPSQQGNNSATGRTSWHHFGGRKRGQSGQGEELGSIPIKREETPKPETQLRREVQQQAAPKSDAPSKKELPTKPETQSRDDVQQAAAPKPGVQQVKDVPPQATAGAENVAQAPEIRVDS